MNRINYLILILLSGVSTANAQYSRYTVQLKDKNGSAFSLSQPAAFLSARSIQRRTKQNINIDSTDLPVSKQYLDSISKINGVRIINTSKWLNNVLVDVPDSNAVVQLVSFSFVHHLTPVAIKHERPLSHKSSKERAPAFVSPAANSLSLSASNATLYDSSVYGKNYPQVHIHKGEYLHNLGFRGQGITIAIIDAGFNSYKTNIAFDSLRANSQVLGEYDFVHRETDVNNDDSHGANCLSIMAANIPGQMIGTAPKASYYLFKSEDVTSEKPVEEQYWIVAAERADSAGADMISSSLGYSNFDDTSLNLNYAQRDGKTAPITIAANMAFAKGMIVTNSSGNSGDVSNDFKYVMCPADGENVLSIGATGTNGTIAPFSSGGPNGAGRRKPDVVSVGLNTVFVNTNGDVLTGSGTSYSNPNMAGLIACLWQAFSELTNADIVDAVKRSADRYNNPDERYGYGIPNMQIAYQLLELRRKEKLNSVLKDSYITAYPVPFRQSLTVYIKAPATATAVLRILDVQGKLIEARSVQVQQGSYYNIYMTPAIFSSGVFYLQYDDGKNKTILKLARL